MLLTVLLLEATIALAIIDFDIVGAIAVAIRMFRASSIAVILQSKWE